MTCEIASETLNIMDLSKQDLKMLWTCLKKEKLLSNHKLKYLTASTGDRKLLRILTEKELLSFSCCIFESKIMNSDLSGFSFNLFEDNLSKVWAIFLCTENLWQALIRQDFVKMVPKTKKLPNWQILTCHFLVGQINGQTYDKKMTLIVQLICHFGHLLLAKFLWN